MRILIAVLCLAFLEGTAQTTLSPGDIVILQMQGDTPDDFIFAPLVDIEAGTQIIFTDCGADADGFRTPNCNEGARRFTAAQAYLAGTVLSLSLNDEEISSYTDTRITGSFALAAGGDQIIAFQGDGESPNFLYIVNGASTEFTGDKSDANQTGLPAGLVVGTTAVAAGAGSGPETEYDNVVYDGTNMPWDATTIANVLTDVGDASNWIGANSITDGSYAAASTAIYTLMNQNILPVSLISFEVELQANTVELTWATASETNNDRFEIERSRDGQSFEKIGSEDGVGNSTTFAQYSHLDKSPLVGTSYYRLKQIDFDGVYSYSDVRVVNYKTMSVSVAPKQTYDRLRINTGNNEDAAVSVYSAAGQLMTEKSFVSSTEINIADLPKGLYFVQVSVAGQATTEKITKL